MKRERIELRKIIEEAAERISLVEVMSRTLN